MILTNLLKFIVIYFDMFSSFSLSGIEKEGMKFSKMYLGQVFSWLTKTTKWSEVANCQTKLIKYNNSQQIKVPKLKYLNSYFWLDIIVFHPKIYFAVAGTAIIWLRKKKILK